MIKEFLEKLNKTKLATNKAVTGFYTNSKLELASGGNDHCNCNCNDCGDGNCHCDCQFFCDPL